MKKLFLTLLLCCASTAAFASGVKITQMPDGGNTVAGDTIPIVRGGVNFKSTFLGLSGTAGGDLSGTYPNPNVFNLKDVTTGVGDAAYSTGWTEGAALYTNAAGGIGALQNTTSTLSQIVQYPEAAKMLYQISQGQFVDPRAFGAVCNATFEDGRDGRGLVSGTSGSPIIQASGFIFKASDVGASISLNAGGSGTAGVNTGTILSVDLVNNRATLSVTPTVSFTGGYVVYGHDDTAGIQSASLNASIYGGKVLAPDNCLIRGLKITSQTTIDGGGTGNLGYAYIPMKPTWFILATGYTEDPVRYGIDVSVTRREAFNGFNLEGIVFPVIDFANASLSCIGSKTGTITPEATELDITNMEVTHCFVGLGYALNQAGQTGLMGGLQTRNNGWFSNGYGWNGSFNDSESIGDIWTGNFYSGLHLGASSIRFIGGRIEESPGGSAGLQDPTNINKAGLSCNGCGVDMTGVEFQFNAAYNMYLVGTYRVMMNGGSLEGGGAKNSPNTTRAEIALAGGAGNNSVLHLNGVTFDHNNPDAGADSLYIFDGRTSGTQNPIVEINGGDVCRNGYITALANFPVGVGNAFQPTTYRVQTSDCPQQFIGRSDYSLINGALGLNTTNPSTGVGFDMLKDTTTVNSSIGLPGGTSANRPTTGIAGMLRYNSDTKQVEAFYNSAWNAFADTTTNIVSIAPGAGVSTTLSSGGTTPIVKNGTLYTDAAYFAGAKGGLILSNDTNSPNTVIDISSGSATDDSSTLMMKLGSAYTKSTAAWSLGTAGGCLDTGAVANSSWYHLFLIERVDTGVSDILCSLSGTNPLFPTNYAFKRDIGVFETDGSAHIRPFVWKGSNYYRADGRALQVSTTTLGTTAVLTTLPDVPPGASVVPIGTYSLSSATSACVLMSSPFEKDEVPDCTYPYTAAPGADTLYQTTSGVVNYNLPAMNTNATQQIRLRASAANTTFGINLRGFTYSFSPTNYSANFLLGVLPSGWTFTRGSTGTFYNSAGVLTTAGVNAPRFDYDPATLSPLGLKIEEAKTNGINSDPGSSTYTGSSSGFLTILHNTGAVVSPDGTNDASSWSDGTGTSVHRAFTTGSTTSGLPYTFSGYAKAGTANVLQVDFSGTQYANFDIINGLVTTSTGTGISAAIKPVNNGWYRVSMSVNSAAGTTISPNINLVNNNATATRQPSYTGTNETLYLYGFDVEQGYLATSYFPTGTRSRDSMVQSTPPLFSATNGSFSVQASLEGTTSGRTPYTASFSDTTTSNEMSLFLTATGQGRGGDTTSGTPFTSAASAGGATVGTAFVQTMNYLSGSNVVQFNGVADGAGTFGAASLPAGINFLTLGDRVDGSKTLDGWIQSYTYSP